MTLENIRVGMRPMPEDGYPIVGFHDQIKGLYLAVMHAAITLAPLVSRLAVKEIIENVQVDELNSWRLSKFSV
ncbi:hypothetical protein [Brevibacillus sp. NRS-1366]|uniref:hypothetical protein n=1 Tax=Brevibacillus sp. NRS-1366 TaxID=3233899 RepID=UPI003D21E65F